MLARPASSLVRRALLVAAAPVLLALVAGDLQAQGKGNAKPAAGKAAAGQPAKAKGTPPGQAKKRVTHTEAVDVSSQVLVAQGYQVARVERVGDTRVIYYYRGNNGRGKGRGPLQRIVVRPSADRFVFEGAPRTVISEIVRRLGF